MTRVRLELTGAETMAEIRQEPREMFCRDFDLGCFDVADAWSCKLGRKALIGDITYYTVPVILVCPLADSLCQP